MRVIYTTQYSPWSAYHGGGQQSTHNLASAMSRRGNRVAVVYTKPPWERIVVPRDLPYEVYWATLPAVRSSRRAVLRPLAPAFMARRVWSLLGDDSVLHASGEEAALVPRLRALRSFRFVITPRYPKYPDELLRAEQGWIDRIKLWMRHSKFVELGMALRGADTICPTSKSAADQVQRAYDVDNDLIHVIPNGVSAEFLRTRWRAEAVSGPILFFGRLARSKGADVLLAALPLLQDDDVTCIIAGRGEEQQNLAAMADDYGVSDRVRFVGWQSPNNIAELLSRCSMAILPSREESFGNAVAEAMASGAPVISTRAGSVPELVQHEETGLLVPADDPEALAHAIRRIRRNPVEARRMGEEARRVIESRYTWDGVAASFEKIYRGIASH